MSNTDGSNTGRKKNSDAAREEQLDQLAQAVRTAYIRRMQEYLGKPYRPGPTADGGVTPAGTKCEPVWPKIVEACLKHEIDPVHYVFAECGRSAKPPYVNQLLSTRRMDAYKARERQRETPLLYVRIRTRSEVEWMRIEHGLLVHMYGNTEEGAWRALLTSRLAGASDLTRYCFAAACGPELFEEVASKYEQRALQQYMLNPRAYDEVWGTFLPDRLKKLARKRLDYGWRTS